MFEAEGAAVKADDLARDGEADARAVGFGREEWREDIFSDLCRDCRAVVGYLNLDAFLCVNSLADSYLALAILRHKGLGGVFQQVYKYLRHQCTVGIEHSIRRLDAHFDLNILVRNERQRLRHQLREVERCFLWCGDACNGTERIDKAEQTVRGCVYRLQALTHSLGIARCREQCMAYGGYRCKRVHYFVRKDAGEFLPRLHLLAVVTALLFLLSRRHAISFPDHKTIDPLLKKYVR